MSRPSASLAANPQTPSQLDECGAPISTSFGMSGNAPTMRQPPRRSTARPSSRQIVLFLKADGLPAEDLVRRIHLVLLGREIGVEPDSDLESLVGDFALLPFLELVRAAGRARVTGRIVCASGEVTLDGGEVIAAAAGRAQGIKAFLRLSLLDAGPFWVWLRQPAGVEREIRAGRQVARLPGPGGPRPRRAGSARPRPRAARSRLLRGPLQSAPAGAAGRAAGLRHGRPAARRPAGATDGEILRDLHRPARAGDRRPGGAGGAGARGHRLDLATCRRRWRGRTASTSCPCWCSSATASTTTGWTSRPRSSTSCWRRGRSIRGPIPTPKADFLDVYRSLAPRKDIVSVHISEKLSQTVVARPGGGGGGAAAVPGAARRGRAGVASGWWTAAAPASGWACSPCSPPAWRGAGSSRTRSSSVWRRCATGMHVLFAVDTLEYLARGGRIGKARALMGNLLGIKPILGRGGRRDRGGRPASAAAGRPIRG